MKTLEEFELGHWRASGACLLLFPAFGLCVNQCPRGSRQCCLVLFWQLSRLLLPLFSHQLAAGVVGPRRISADEVGTPGSRKANRSTPHHAPFRSGLQGPAIPSST